MCICCPLVVAMSGAESCLRPSPSAGKNPGCHPAHHLAPPYSPSPPYPSPHQLLVCLLNIDDDEASNPPHTDLCLSYRLGRISWSLSNILTT